MLTVIAITISIILWITYEIWKSPLYDDDMFIIRKERTFKDLFKKK